MRHYIANIGRIWSTVIITLLSILLSLLITSIFDFSFNSKVSQYSIMAAIVTPAIVAPLMSWYVIGLLITIHHMEEEQRNLAAFDYLTDTMTRRLFLESSLKLLEQAKRDNKTFTIALIDIDNFKSINDTYGHAVGDEILVSFTQTMRKVLRTNDVIGRIGGEEFAVTMLGVSTQDAIMALERLRVAVENDTVLNVDKVVPYTVSMGVSEYDEKLSNTIGNILKDADDALYDAKSQGKNRINTLQQ